MMTYSETLNYLYEQLPMFSRIGAAAYKKDLTNTIELCKACGDPHEQFKSIHIAGTNGKGSVSHMLAAILQTTGYNTGLYTSPHLKDFRERIKLNGEICSESFVVDFIEKIEPQIEILQPSFFEITVAMAFKYFAENKVDMAVIETGLGGRLDSTNIIVPELSVITNIGWDHMDMLGNTLESIAFEKAGIIKTNIPVVIGESLPEIKSVFTKVAQEKKAPCTFAEDHFYITDFSYRGHQLNIEVADKQKDEHYKYQLDLPGIYQRKNLVTVLEAVHQLQLNKVDIRQAGLQSALKSVKRLTGLHARWEKIRDSPSVVLDVAHNIDGMRQVAEQLELMSYRELHIVLGFVKDKDVKKILALLPLTANYYFTKAQIPRALPESELAAIARTLNLTGKEFADVNTALSEAMTHAHSDDLVLVCGSVFLAGEVNI